jgi:hypothetical protein
MTRFIRITLATAAMALASAGAHALEPRVGVKLRALDKITGNSTDISAKVGETLTFGRLKVTVRACFQSPPEDTPESAAFLEIHATAPAGKVQNDKPANTSRMNKGPQPIGPDGLLFSGWMFASSPGLSALEHPTYDVWVISCNTSGPSSAAAPAAPAAPETPPADPPVEPN